MADQCASPLKCVFCSARINVNLSESFLFILIYFLRIMYRTTPSSLSFMSRPLLEHQTIINLLILISHSFHPSKLESSLGQRPNGTTIHANVENPRLLLDSPASGLTAVRVCINLDAVRRPDAAVSRYVALAAGQSRESADSLRRIKRSQRQVKLRCVERFRQISRPHGHFGNMKRTYLHA